MLIEIHIIQNFAPSNLNRDDTNNPKDCEFGGVRRARISSQCIKRAVRLEPIFAETTRVPSGERTRWLAMDIKKTLIKKGKLEEQAAQEATAFISELLGGMDEAKPGRSKVLFYISDEEKTHIANALIENWDDPNEDKYKDLVKEYKKIFENRSSSPDIALFGRMLADDPKLSLDASCQVAHAISTHRVNMDVDFFTAVDDLLVEDESGAGMISVTGFNSACFYRYACLDWRQLLKNLDGNRELAVKTVQGFLLSSIRAIPTGKQNSFAAQNPPSFVMTVIRHNGMAWSLVNSFEKPVNADKAHGLVENSILALDQYWGDLLRVYGGDHKLAVLSVNKNINLENTKKAVVENVNRLIDVVTDALPKE